MYMGRKSKPSGDSGPQLLQCLNGSNPGTGLLLTVPPVQAYLEYLGGQLWVRLGACLWWLTSVLIMGLAAAVAGVRR